MLTFKNKPLQPKLTIGQPNDRYEQEADAKADQFMQSPKINSFPIQRECDHCEEEALQMKPIQATSQPMVQKEEDEFDISPEPEGSGLDTEMYHPANPAFMLRPPTIFGSATPRLPAGSFECPPGNFACFLQRIKMNIDENLQTNAHHFYRIGSLYPEDNQMMEDAFFRFGLGLNLLETTFDFLGAGDSMVTPLALVTGLGLKTLTVIQDGELVIDYQLELPNNTRLEFNVGVYGDPENLLDTSQYQVDTGVNLIYNW